MIAWSLPWSGLLSASAVTSISMEIRLELEPWLILWSRMICAVTFTDDQLNAQIQLRRTQNDLDRGRSIVTSEQEQTAAQKRGAER